MKLIDAENLKRHFDVKGAKFESESIIKTIDRMPAIVTWCPQWIFVNDRLPKDGEPCLICVLNEDDEFYTEQNVYYRDSKLKTWFGSSYNAWDYDDIEILAWMPLPEPLEVRKKL